MTLKRTANPSPINLLRDELHALFSDFPTSSGRGEKAVAVDVVDGPRYVEIRVDLLGLAPDDLEIELDGDMLRLRGSRLVEADEAEAGRRLHARKRWHFLRGIQIPASLAVETADATYEHGLLTIRLDKRRDSSQR